jgi:hypothetical protein
MSKTFTTSDVASHSKPQDLWIIVDDDVYDLTKFQDDHPGTCMLAISPPMLFIFPLPLPIASATKQRRWHRWQEDPVAGRRQRCIKTVLEVPQRGHPEEVQAVSAGRIARHQETRCGGCEARCRCRRTPTYERSQGRNCNVIERRGGRRAGAFWSTDSLCRSILVSRGKRTSVHQ